MTIAEPKKQSVTAALASVMAMLPAIGKDNKSPQGYSYRGIEAITKQLQPLLAAHGVVISPRSTITDVRPSPAMKEGWQDVYMTVEWTITGPDASTLIAQTTGVGRDNSDKGANKAQTQAYKYLLLHLLCIADAKDDADGQTYEHDRQAPPAPKPFDVERFKKACEDEDIDPLDVLAHAALDKNLDELTFDDRGRLIASLGTLASLKTLEPVEGSDSKKDEAQG